MLLYHTSSLNGDCFCTLLTSIAGAANHLCAMESMASPCAHRIRQPCGETHHPSLTGKRERESTSLKEQSLMSLSQRKGERGSAISPCAPLRDAMSDTMRVTVISDRTLINRMRIGLHTVIVRSPLDYLPMQIEIEVNSLQLSSIHWSYSIYSMA